MRYSIITPVYNRADCISRCINSVIRQLACLDAEIEHIIVDDGSEDQTPVIIQQYASQYPHIHFIRFDGNRGTNAARNAAIQAAEGEFCILLDSDDYFVDGAIAIVEHVRKTSPGYWYYLLAPDDMTDRYTTLFPMESGCFVLKFEDFLSRKLSCDFIHVIASPIVKKYPFDEELRVYEGVFFLRFYREARKILFKNEIVTIRERSRRDSATREILPVSKQVLEKTVLSLRLNLVWFEKDYIRCKAYGVLQELYVVYLDNLLRLSDYESVFQVFNKMREMNLKVPGKYRFIYGLRMGFMYQFAVCLYFRIKYHMLNKQLK